MATTTIGSISVSDISAGANFVLTATDGNGVTVPFTSDGPPLWESSDPSLFTLTPAADSKSCKAVPAANSGKVGSANITATFTVGGNVQRVVFPIADTVSGEALFSGTATAL